MDMAGGSELDRAEAEVWRSLGLNPRHHEVRLAHTGTTAHVTEVGDPAGPPVVFVHGGGVAGPSWGDLAAQLPGFRCLLLDRPGCSRSEPFAISSFDDVLALTDSLVADVLDGLGLDRASVVGTSYGGAYAMRGTAAHPERVDRLVLLGWCLGMPGTITPMWFRMGALPGIRHLNGAMPMRGALLRAGLRRFSMGRAVDEGRFSDEALAWLAALYRETDTMRHESRIAGLTVSLRNGWDPRLSWSDDLLAAVTAPTLVLFGDEDHFGTYEGANSLEDKMTDARVQLLTEAGHAPWLDRTEAAVAEIVDHLPPL